MSLQPLLSLLADGAVHSGQQLAEELAVSRAAIWKKIEQLIALGVRIEKIHAKGYQLVTPIELLDAQHTLSLLSPVASERLAKLDIFFSVDSTNSEALRALQQLPISSKQQCVVVLAEHQSSGRGRRGRVWQSPLASNLYFSLAWQCPGGVQALTGLSLAVGIVLAERLNRYLDTDEIQVKWPNDLWWRDHKLAGILIDVVGDVTAECNVVIGVGLNVALRQVWRAEDMPPVAAWTSVNEIAAPSLSVSRNALAALLIEALVDLLADYMKVGIAGYVKRFDGLDALRGREVVVDGHDGIVIGVARGIDSQGLLRLETAMGVRSINAAEASLRVH